MPKKRHQPGEIVAKLRQVDVLVSQGQSQADAVRSIGVTEVTYCHWRQEYGGLKTDQVKRLKDLETGNARLRKAVSDLMLDKQMPDHSMGADQHPRETVAVTILGVLSSGEYAECPLHRSSDSCSSRYHRSSWRDPARCRSATAPSNRVPLCHAAPRGRRAYPRS